MGQFYGIETIKVLEIASPSTLNWPGGSRIRIGGEGFLFEDPIVLDTATDIDTGAIAQETNYYVYIVFNSGTQLSYLRYSLSAEGPDGETNYRLIGVFQTEKLSTDIRIVQNSLDGNVPFIENKDNTPVGAIVSLGKSGVPTGYLPCDGAAVSRTIYADLYAEIGDTHGEGDGSTTFNVPDLRGRFLRGVDEGQGRDPDAGTRTAPATGGASGDAVGSLQDEATKPNGMSASTTATTTGSTNGAGGHSHSESTVSATTTATQLNGLFMNAGGDARYVIEAGSTTGAEPDHSHSITATTTATTNLSGDNETRVKNVAVKYAIKY